MSDCILVVDDEPDFEPLLRQQFRRDLKCGRFTMEFAASAPAALVRAANITSRSLMLILSDINMPGMSGLDMLPEGRWSLSDGSKECRLSEFVARAWLNSIGFWFWTDARPRWARAF